MGSSPEESASELSFQLNQSMRDAIISHARSDSPRECCGVIVGRSGRPERLLPLRNVAEGNRFYEIDPAQLIQLEFEELPRDNSEIVAIYHSHPESPASPSRTDVELAYWPEVVYLICSLEFSDNPVIRGFRIREGQIYEVSLSS